MNSFVSLHFNCASIICWRLRLYCCCLWIYKVSGNGIHISCNYWWHRIWLSAEQKLVAESRASLIKSQMKFINESCRRAQERLQCYRAVKTLEKELEEQKVRGKQLVMMRREHREKLQKFVQYFNLCTLENFQMVNQKKSASGTTSVKPVYVEVIVTCSRFAIVWWSR